MWSYQFKNPTSFIKTIELLKDLLDTINFEFMSDGIHFEMMDNAHVSLANCKFHSGSFTNIVYGGSLQKGINLKYLYMCLKCVKMTDVVTIMLYSGQEKIQIDIQKESGEFYSFSLPAIVMEIEHLSIPADVEYDTRFLMLSNDFTESIKNISLFGSDIEIESIGKLITMRGKSTEGELSITMGFPYESIDVLKNSKVSYSNRYLQIFSKGNYISDKVSVSFSEEEPLCISYEVEDKSSVKFYLAPKYSD